MPQLWRVGNRYISREEMLKIRNKKIAEAKKKEREVFQMEETVLPVILHKKNIKNDPEKVKEIMEVEKNKIRQLLEEVKAEKAGTVVKETKVEAPNKKNKTKK